MAGRAPRVVSGLPSPRGLVALEGHAVRAPDPLSFGAATEWRSVPERCRASVVARALLAPVAPAATCRIAHAGDAARARDKVVSVGRLRRVGQRAAEPRVSARGRAGRTAADR